MESLSNFFLTAVLLHLHPTNVGSEAITWHAYSTGVTQKQNESVGSALLE